MSRSSAYIPPWFISSVPSACPRSFLLKQILKSKQLDVPDEWCEPLAGVWEWWRWWLSGVEVSQTGRPSSGSRRAEIRNLRFPRQQGFLLITRWREGKICRDIAMKRCWHLRAEGGFHLFFKIQKWQRQNWVYYLPLMRHYSPPLKKCIRVVIYFRFLYLMMKTDIPQWTYIIWDDNYLRQKNKFLDTAYKKTKYYCRAICEGV